MYPMINYWHVDDCRKIFHDGQLYFQLRVHFMFMSFTGEGTGLILLEAELFDSYTPSYGDVIVLTYDDAGRVIKACVGDF